MRRLTILLLLTAIAAACGREGTETGPVTITLMAHDSFADAVTDETFAEFTAETGHLVEVLAAGDAGAMVNQAILTADNPLADLMFGVDDTFLTRAVEAGIFEPFTSSALESVPESLRAGGDSVTPIDYGDVCLNYDKAAFSDLLPPPSGLDDLIDPAYRGMLVVEDPTTSSPGLAFLLATIDLLGEGGWQPYWISLEQNGTLVAPGWTEAYYSEFSGGAGEGGRPLVVSYASSPPAEVIFSETPIDEAPTGVITEGCYRQVEFAGILAGTSDPGPAGQLIDFMLSRRFQETIPLTWFVFPASVDATLPPEFVEHTVIPADPVQMDPTTIETNRQSWLEQWADIFR
ncbi:MAG: thiamine ABC transporter substrate-binding protein [Acidimicrobiia bacterium]